MDTDKFLVLFDGSLSFEANIKAVIMKKWY